LNVFLAARLISKDGKVIVWNRSRRTSPTNATSASLIEKVRMKQIQLMDKITVYVKWKLLIERNINRSKPELTVPVWRTIFVGFTQCQGGSYKLGIDRKKVEIRADSIPIFFSPLEIMGTFQFTDKEKLAVLKRMPYLRSAIPYVFPNGVAVENGGEEEE
jgi:hypothetical protein